MCTKKVYSWSLVAFNIIFVIVGVVSLSLGLYLKFDDHGLMRIFEKVPGGAVQGQDEIADLLKGLWIAMVIFGAILFGIGFLGCCGAWKEIKIFLNVYGLILGLMVIAQLAFGIFFVVEGTNGPLDSGLRHLLKQYKHGLDYKNNKLVLPTAPVDLSLDMLQQKMQCCGVDGAADYANAALVPSWDQSYTITAGPLTAKVPLSCCQVNNTDEWMKLQNLEFNNPAGCMNTAVTATNIKGCYDKINEFLDENRIMMLIISLVIVIIEALAVLFAYWLYKDVQKAEYDKV